MQKTVDPFFASSAGTGSALGVPGAGNGRFAPVLAGDIGCNRMGESVLSSAAGGKLGHEAGSAAGLQNRVSFGEALRAAEEAMASTSTGLRPMAGSEERPPKSARRCSFGEALKAAGQDSAATVPGLMPLNSAAAAFFLATRRNEDRSELGSSTPPSAPWNTSLVASSPDKHRAIRCGQGSGRRSETFTRDEHSTTWKLDGSRVESSLRIEEDKLFSVRSHGPVQQRVLTRRRCKTSDADGSFSRIEVQTVTEVRHA